jgi:hypothetical protein
MNIFKLVLLSSLTFVFFGILRAALFIYILLLPDSPLGGVGTMGSSYKWQSLGFEACSGSRCKAIAHKTPPSLE